MANVFSLLFTKTPVLWENARKGEDEAQVSGAGGGDVAPLV